MKITSLKFVDWSVLIVSVLFFLGCIASSQRSAKTMKKGQFSSGLSYLNCSSLEDKDDESLVLYDIDMRYGLGSGIDIGLMYTFDPKGGRDNAFGSIWSDIKIQTCNLENEVNKPIFSTGLNIGYMHEQEIHTMSVPLMFSIPISKYVTPGLIYRIDFLSDEFFPTSESFEDPRHLFGVNTEFNLKEINRERWIPKIGLTLGVMNSITGGNGDNVLFFNVGMSFDSPF